MENVVNDPAPVSNLRFQSEQHPLVKLEHDSRASYCLSLIHKAADARAADLAEGLEVLDLGCNNGYGTMTIAERCRRIVGVDVSPRAIEAARQAHARANVSYQVVDGTVLPFADNSFDLVTSFQVIEHVKAVQPYLRKIHRVLRHSGRTIFTTPNRCIRLDPGMKPWNEFHVTEYDAEQLVRVLGAEFATVSVKGLFAAPELYNLERERVGAARAMVRKLQSEISAVANAEDRSLAHPRADLRQILRRGRRALRRLRKAPAIKRAAAEAEAADRAALPAFVRRWSVADFHYSDQNLDEALDLMAICSTAR